MQKLCTGRCNRRGGACNRRGGAQRLGTDHSTLKRSYLLAPNSDFDDLRHFGKVTQRATQSIKVLDLIHNRSKQYSTPRAILVSEEHWKTFLSSPSWTKSTPTPPPLQMCQHH
jgi:hypothetical protein